MGSYVEQLECLYCSQSHSFVLQRCPKATDVYWQPWPECWITPRAGCRFQRAISSASRTSAVRRWSAMAQPMNRFLETVWCLDLAWHVQQTARLPADRYGTRQAAYDLQKLRAKGFIQPVAGSRRYRVTTEGTRTIAALVVLRDRVIKPLLAGAVVLTVEHTATGFTVVDAHYAALRKEMLALFADLGLAAA